MHGTLIANLKTLAAHEVNFVVVGGVGAVIQGCPVMTFDLDIVHERSQANLQCLARALAEIDAVYRFQPQRRLRPAAEALAGPGHHLLRTVHGPMDVLGEIGNGHDYGELVKTSEAIDIGDGLTVAVLSLEWLIRIKEEVGAPKDLAVLDILRETLRLRRSD
jgi:hypothetical protein